MNVILEENAICIVVKRYHSMWINLVPITLQSHCTGLTWVKDVYAPYVELRRRRRRSMSLRPPENTCLGISDPLEKTQFHIWYAPPFSYVKFDMRSFIYVCKSQFLTRKVLWQMQSAALVERSYDICHNYKSKFLKKSLRHQCIKVQLQIRILCKIK